MRTAKNVTDTPLTLSDRLIFALIGAAFGTVMGAALCYGAALAFTLAAIPTQIIPFSVVYFAFVGLAMGPFVGDFVAATIGGLLDILSITSSYARPLFTDERTFRPLWVGLSFLLWLAASWFIYLRG